MRRTRGDQRVACAAVEAERVLARRRHHARIAARQQSAQLGRQAQHAVLRPARSAEQGRRRKLGLTAAPQPPIRPWAARRLE